METSLSIRAIRAIRAPDTDDPASHPADPTDAAIALSPSRASDFKTCPQLYKFRFIDQVPEDQGPAAARGTLVHTVLQKIFGLPANERTLDNALRMLSDGCEALEIAPEVLPGVVTEAERLLTNYFELEDPATIDPHELEWWVEYQNEDLMLRGIIDRVEVDDGGDVVITDYKTGRSPSETFALGSFFGLKFYALVCWRNFGWLPKQLRLVHLQGASGPEVITLTPTPQMLDGMERQLSAVSNAIEKAKRTGDWRPKRGRACDWCAHRAICPAFSN